MPVLFWRHFEQENGVVDAANNGRENR